MTTLSGERIRVHGVVQGVGFRPTVWRIAQELGLRGLVRNDGAGVTIDAWAEPAVLTHFSVRLQAEAPPLARIDSIDRSPLSGQVAPANFQIETSHKSPVQTGIAPDAAVCKACLTETLDSASRRHRYPFTNCTHCGPRFSIIRALPYDRAQTSMALFTLCPDCAQEYRDPTDRRFHAQPNACPRCGPQVHLESLHGENASTPSDVLATAAELIEQGFIIAIKGIGGFHLACDASNETTVQRLRQSKNRPAKPFALMARDLDTIGRYCQIEPIAQTALESTTAPIVLLPINGPDRLAPSIAPGQNNLGFMLPYTPLHHLLLQRLAQPIVLTSGNLSDEPQCIADEDARQRLAACADYLLWHEREIVNRLDDSVVRIVAGTTQVLRRARGYAPAPLPLPDGFVNAPAILALGGDLKNSFCLLNNGQAIVSQHIGELANAAAWDDYLKNLALYQELFQHRPQCLAIDLHPDYMSSKHGREHARQKRLELIEVQHHHAHIASCLAENQISLDSLPVLGIALDGLGYGADDTLWGGEFLRANYRHCERLATFKPVALLGGAQAMREPWRNTYAHLQAALGWGNDQAPFAELELTAFLERQPLATLAAMLDRGINSPPASSCGRLFDAVAAAVGLCRERISFEGEAAQALEAIVDESTLYHEADSQAYTCTIMRLANNDLLYLEPKPLWQALLQDLAASTPAGVIAARFHKGLARAITAMAVKLCPSRENRVVALSGGVMQNKVLFEQLDARLQAQGFTVLSHHQVPAGDGGLALGQALIAAAQRSEFVSKMPSWHF